MVGKEYYLLTRPNAIAAVAVNAWYNLQQRKRHHLQTGYYRMGGVCGGRALKYYFEAEHYRGTGYYLYTKHQRNYFFGGK